MKYKSKGIATADSAQEAILSSVIEDVCARLADNKRVNQSLPGGGALQMDRLLPFICIYRRNPARRDEGTAKLVVSEASYLCAPGVAIERQGLKLLIRRIAETAVEQLGSFLILETWTSDDKSEFDKTTGEAILPRPEFRILTRREHRPQGAVATLEFALQELRIHRKAGHVQVRLDKKNHPPGMAPLISENVAERIGCHIVGLEIRPIFRDPETGEVFDRVLRSLGREMTTALKKSFFIFALNRTRVRPEHYFALGSSRLTRQVQSVDRQLAELSRRFKFLLLVTPINSERAWNSFEKNGYAKTPVFQYRPLDSDPLLLKRSLMKIATERIDDPALAYVMRQVQYELDRQITMLGDIGTPRFLPGSLQVFDGVNAKLLALAMEILQTLADSEQDSEKSVMLSATEFARLAEKEIKFYRNQSPGFAARAIVRDDMYSGLLCSGGDLHIGKHTQIAKHRAEALLQHEVGTHLVTYYNGAAQPLRLLQVGLAGYDAFQEGLAVLSEFMVGGLSAGRMRTLAARVIVTDRMVRGDSFPDVFQQLVDEHGFQPRTAYTITTRVFRGGGLTKDAVYLQGLVEILDYISRGEDLEPLLVGKIAVDHVPIVQQLLLSGVLCQPRVRPRYLARSDARERLESISKKTTVLDLISNEGNEP